MLCTSSRCGHAIHIAFVFPWQEGCEREDDEDLSGDVQDGGHDVFDAFKICGSVFGWWVSM